MDLQPKPSPGQFGLSSPSLCLRPVVPALAPSSLSRLLSSYALKLFLAFLHGQKFAVGLIPLGPGGLAEHLRFKLRALSDGALSGVVAYGFVGSHLMLLR